MDPRGGWDLTVSIARSFRIVAILAMAHDREEKCCCKQDTRLQRVLRDVSRVPVRDAVGGKRHKRT